jgi:uncharacterized hydrophobic protein (TIGR00271 family)
MAPDDRATRTGWTRAAVARGLIGLVSGLIALFRPDDAAVVLGAALVAVSLLELTVRVSTADPVADTLRRRRRLIRVAAGVLAGVGLIGSAVGGAELEMRVLAVTLAVVAVVDMWGAWHAPRPALRGLRVTRAALAFTAALVLVTIPDVAFRITVFVASIGWIVVGVIALVNVAFPGRLLTADGRTPTGLIEIIGAWLRSRDVGEARRDEILDAYDYDPADTAKLGRFSVLLILAGIIASAGLIANSVASIIGAMIIAPLMGPIVGIALGIVTGIPRRAVQSLVVAVAGTVVTVLIGIVMGAWLGGAPGVSSNSEIVGRTSPTIVDLVVALAAGAAGAYAASNAKVADSLPGVAIAISLVPPLETAGILLSLGQTGEAAGALLLFSTNFVSIVLAASLVFVLTGVIPFDRFTRNAERTQAWVATFAVAGLLLIIPLAIGGQQAFAAAADQQLADAAVATWLLPAPSFVVVEVDVSGDDVRVSVAGPGTPPDPVILQRLLDFAFDRPVQLGLAVTQTVLYSTPPDAPSSAAP